jgi:hypothetical protein
VLVNSDGIFVNLILVIVSKHILDNSYDKKNHETILPS